jgi:hypothetical protein
VAIQFHTSSLTANQGLECLIASFAEMQEFSIAAPYTAAPWLASAGEEHRVHFVCGFELVCSHVVLNKDLPQMRNPIVSVSPR